MRVQFISRNNNTVKLIQELAHLGRVPSVGELISFDSEKNKDNYDYKDNFRGSYIHTNLADRIISVYYE